MYIQLPQIYSSIVRNVLSNRNFLILQNTFLTLLDLVCVDSDFFYCNFFLISINDKWRAIRMFFLLWKSNPIKEKIQFLRNRKYGFLLNFPLPYLFSRRRSPSWSLNAAKTHFQFVTGTMNGQTFPGPVILHSSSLHIVCGAMSQATYYYYHFARNTCARPSYSNAYYSLTTFLDASPSHSILSECDWLCFVRMNECRGKKCRTGTVSSCPMSIDVSNQTNMHIWFRI